MTTSRAARRATGLALGTLLAAAACSSSSDAGAPSSATPSSAAPSASAADSSPSSPAAPSDTPPSTPGAPTGGAATAIVKNSSAKTTAAGSARITFVETVTTSRQPAVTVHATGVEDFRSRSASFRMTVPKAGTLEIRLLAGVLYEHLPAAARRSTGGKPWLKIDLKKAAAATGASGLFSDPGDNLGYTRGLTGAVQTLGPATVGGVHTTRYSATIDPGAAGTDAKGRQLSKLAQRLGIARIPVQLWIDDGGRLRRIALTEKASHLPANGRTTAATIDITETLSDFGIPVHVSPPPRAQTVDLARALQHRQSA